MLKSKNLTPQLGEKHIIGLRRIPTRKKVPVPTDLSTAAPPAVIKGFGEVLTERSPCFFPSYRNVSP